MNRDLFAIGEAARLRGMTVKALRFYGRIGLFEPRYIDPKTKYRYYSAEQFIRLDIIKAARAMGMGLKEIKALFARGDADALMGALKARREAVEERIAGLRRTAASIDAAASAISDSLATAGQRGAYVREIPERRILIREIRGVLDAAAADAGYASLERSIEERRLINRYGTGIVLARDGNKSFRPSGFFAVVGIDEGSTVSGLSSLPAGRYLCVRYGAGNALSQQAKFRARLKREKLEPLMIVQADTLDDVFSEGSAQAELQALLRGA
jgi:MerR family transcriptional activator of bmr gene